MRHITEGRFACALMAPSAGTRASAWSRRRHPELQWRIRYVWNIGEIVGGPIGALVGQQVGGLLDCNP